MQNVNTTFENLHLTTKPRLSETYETIVDPITGETKRELKPRYNPTTGLQDWQIGATVLTIGNKVEKLVEQDGQIVDKSYYRGTCMVCAVNLQTGEVVLKDGKPVEVELGFVVSHKMIADIRVGISYWATLTPTADRRFLASIGNLRVKSLVADETVFAGFDWDALAQAKANPAGQINTTV